MIFQNTLYNLSKIWFFFQIFDQFRQKVEHKENHMKIYIQQQSLSILISEVRENGWDPSTSWVWGNFQFNETEKSFVIGSSLVNRLLID